MNDKLADCEPLARLLFAGLWTVADREGRLDDAPRKIKVQTLPYDDFDCNALLNQLVETGFIQRYEHENSKYIQVLNFAKHQNPHMKEAESLIPAPTLHHTSIVQNVPYPLSPIPLIESPILKTDSLDSISFGLFWDSYNYKINKRKAITAFKKVQDKVDIQNLLDKIRDYDKYLQTTGISKQHPSTWLNGEGWENDYKQLTKGNNGTYKQAARLGTGTTETEAQRRERLSHAGK